MARPTLGPEWLRQARGRVLGWFLEGNRSHLVRSLDEILAESHATGSLIEGLRWFRWTYPRYGVNPWRVYAEGMGLTAAFGLTLIGAAMAGKRLADDR